MILEVQIQIFGAWAGAPWQSFHFQKIPGGLNFNIFCENRHEASFYIKELTQEKKSKFEFLKLPFWTPEKAVLRSRSRLSRHF